MKSFFVLLVSICIFPGFSFAATCVSLGNGDWNSSSSWSCGAIPTGGDNITIRPGDTITISTVTSIIGPPVTIHVDGVFMFDTPSAKLRLPCGSVIIISSTGSIESSGVGQSSHSIRICGDDVWTGSDGPLTGPLVIGIVLPVELTFFKAESSGSNIEFMWQTASERDNDFFTLEGSNDGFTWNEMSRISGAGTSQDVQNYAFNSPNRDNFNYFRLKQTDFDGKFDYSEVVYISTEVTIMKVFPNPNNGSELTIQLPFKSYGQLQVFTGDGRVVHSLMLNGLKEIELNNLNLEAGTYFLQVQERDQVLTERLIMK